jgi:predicted DNA-binding transcriptional regulator AlpA
MESMHEINTSPIPTGDLKNRKEASQITGFSAATLAKWATVGKGPRFLKFGTGRSAAVRYRESDLREWIDSADVRGGGRAA